MTNASKYVPVCESGAIIKTDDNLPLPLWVASHVSQAGLLHYGLSKYIHRRNEGNISENIDVRLSLNLKELAVRKIILIHHKSCKADKLVYE